MLWIIFSTPPPPHLTHSASMKFVLLLKEIGIAWECAPRLSVASWWAHEPVLFLEDKIYLYIQGIQFL